jgi:glutamate-1-semialdehyde 2,1-aminomutase
VYQAGTLSGNPIAMVAGFTLLKVLKDNPSIYSDLEEKTTGLHNGLQRCFKERNIPVMINRVGSMISIHFSEKPVTDFSSSASANIQNFNKFFHSMLKKGVYLPPSAFESWFVSNALSAKDIDQTITAAYESVEELN